MAGRKLRLQIQQSDEHGECRSPRWYGQHAITTNDITGSITKILITDSMGKQISITIGKNGGIRVVNTNTETAGGHKSLIDPSDPKSKTQLNSDQNFPSHFLENNQRGSENTLEPNLQCVKEEVIEPEEESSILFKEVLDVISEGYNLESLAPAEVQEDFRTVIENIKSEEPDIPGNFETVYINSAVIMPENDENAKEAQGSQEFPDLINESTNYTAVQSLLCRLCASQRKDMVYIFGNNKSYKNILKKMESCLPILVRKTDALPHQVCRLCLEKLELCHKFRTTVAEVEKQFIELSEKVAEELRYTEENGRTYLQRNRELDRINPAEELRSSLSAIEKLEDKDTVDDQEDIIFVGEAIQAEPVAEQNAIYDIIKCRICGMFFGSPKSCYTHSESHYSYNYYPCCICDSTFTSGEDSFRHYEEHAARQILQRREAMYQKQIAGQNLRFTPIAEGNSSSNITENLVKKDDHDVEMVCVGESVKAETSTEQSDDQDIIKCRICGLYFGTGKSCYAHSEIHYSYNYFPCSMCDETFSNRDDSYEHSIGHTARKCSQKRTVIYEKEISGNNLRSTPINESDNTEKEAEIAIEETVNSRNFTQQSNYHDIIKCRICGLYFGTPKSCYIHSEIHVSENQYPCSMCDKTFTNKADSRRHSYEHTVHNLEQRKAMMYKKPNSGYNLRSTSITESNIASNGVERIMEKDKADDEFLSAEETTDDQSSTDQSDDRDMVKCLICGLYFGTANSCYMHSKIHVKENHFPCSMCDKIFTNEKESYKHREEHNVPKTLKKSAAMYTKKLSSKRKQSHSMTENDKPPKSEREKVAEKDDHIPCNEKTVENQVPAERIDENDMIRCRICGAEFENAEGCFSHSSVHAGKNYHPCTMCFKIFTTEKRAYKHSLKHVTDIANEASPLNHVCTLCGKRFMTEDRLEFHKINHNRGTKTGFCEKCDKIFSSESALYDHALNMHKEHNEHEEHETNKKFRWTKI